MDEKKIKKIIKDFSDFLGICYGGILDDKEREDICSTLKALIEVNVLPKKAQTGNIAIANEIFKKSGLTYREIG